MVVAPSDQIVRYVSHTIADEIKEHAGNRKRKVGFSADELPIKKVRYGDVVISKPNPTTASKSSAALRKVELQSRQPDVGVGLVPHPTEEFISSSVTPTPEHEDYEDSGSPHDGSVRTRCASERYVILTSSSEHGDVDTVVSPKTTYPKPHVQTEVENVTVGPVDKVGVLLFLGTVLMLLIFLRMGLGPPLFSGIGLGLLPLSLMMVLQLMIFSSLRLLTPATQDIYVPHWDVTNDTRLDDFVMCRNLIDHMPPLGFWASLRNLHDADFLDFLNINSAQHACMVSELRLWYEHESPIMEKFKQKFMRSWVIELHRRASELKFADVAKLDEVTSLTGQNAELSGTCFGLELVYDGLKNQVAKLEVDCESLCGKVDGEAKLRAEFMTSDTAYPLQLNTAYRSSDTCMARSSTKELLTPFKEPEQEFRSSRKLFKTLSLDESRLPEYNLFFDLEENSEEEVAETMAEIMEQYMSKT
ncbi:hypothetical protein Tco_0375023 [Tanacetum coccineum]